MEDLRLTEEEIREHYPDEDIDTVFNILTRFDLQVGNWYRYADIKDFGDVFPKRHSDYVMKTLGLEEYPPLYFQYVGGENPWSQATDNKIMYIDRYKYMCYHEEEYAKYGIDWLNGAECEVNDILKLVNRMLYREVDEKDYKSIDYLKEIKDRIEYKLMCYDGALTRYLDGMEESASRQEIHDEHYPYSEEVN